MHVRIVEQRPKLLQGKILVIIAIFFTFVMHNENFELLVDWMLVCIEQTFDEGVDGSKRDRRTGDSNPVLDGRKPWWQLFDLDGIG